MSIFLIPALISLLFKLFILVHVLRGGKVSTIFLSLIVVFAIHNSIELAGYLYFIINNVEILNLVFRLYYVATVYVLMYVLLHALTVSKLNSQYKTAVLVLLPTALSILLLFSNSIISGQYTIGYAVAAIKGPFYSLFGIYSLLFIAGSVFVLIYRQRTATTQLTSYRCKSSLFALTPFFTVFSLVIVFKFINIPINAAGLAPIATTLFLIIVLKTESKHKLSDIRRLLPLSLERRTADNFLSMLDTYVKNKNVENVYKDLQHGIEREIVSYSLKKCDHNIADTAKLMGIKNRSTLYAMINRLDINIEALKKAE